MKGYRVSTSKNDAQNWRDRGTCASCTQNQFTPTEKENDMELKSLPCQTLHTQATRAHNTTAMDTNEKATHLVK